jgi:hypothetical protein
MRSAGFRRFEQKKGRRPGIRALPTDEVAYPELERRGFVIPEAVEEIGVRAYVEPGGRKPKWAPSAERRSSRQALIVRAVPRTDGTLGLLAWAISDRDAPSVPVRSGLVVPDDASEEEIASLRSDGLDVRQLRDFVGKVFLPQAWRRQIPVVGFDLPRVLGLMARDWTATEDGGGLSLILATAPADALTPKQRRGRRRLRDGGYEIPWVPRVLVDPLDGERAFVSFSRTVDKGKGGPGHFIDLHIVQGAQGRASRTPAELVEAHGLAIPEGQGPEAHLREVEVLARCYWRMLARHESIVGRAWGMDRIQSGGSYSKALLERVGQVPPLVRWPNFPKWVLGVSAESFFGGEYHLDHRGELIANVVPFDIQSEYGLAAVLTRASRVLAAQKLRIQPIDPVKLTERLRTITLDNALNPKLYAELGFTFARLVLLGQVVPSRPAEDGEWPLRVAPTWCREPTWHHALTLARAVLDPASAPLEDGQVIEAFRIVSEGRQRGLASVDFPGLGRFDQTSRNADLFAFFGSGRALLQAGEPQADLGPWTAKDLDRFLKGVIPMAAFGIFAEVRPRRARGRRERVTVWGGDRTPRRAHMRVVEEPGPWQFWPIASAVTAAGRLLFHVVSLLVAEEGGRRA